MGCAVLVPPPDCGVLGEGVLSTAVLGVAARRTAVGDVTLLTLGAPAGLGILGT